ncbi:hypothetical protein G6F57_019492 [Rhizopus arrhizus]|nr:hypothetical protein G6F57_019492 [Rhizopus arrhizus]
MDPRAMAALVGFGEHAHGLAAHVPQALHIRQQVGAAHRLSEVDLDDHFAGGIGLLGIVGIAAGIHRRRLALPARRIAAHAGFATRSRPRSRRRGAGRGERLRRLPGDPAHAGDVHEKGSQAGQGGSEMISLNLVTLLYLIASVCFIQALKGLSHPTTSRLGNAFGMAGMAIAVLTTAALIVGLAREGTATVGLGWVLLGLLVGGTVGPLMARRGEMA